MPTDGPNAPTTGISFSPWTLNSRAYLYDTETETDDVNASVGPVMTSTTTPSISAILRVRGFGFSVPTDAINIQATFKVYGRRIQEALFAPSCILQLCDPGAVGDSKTVINNFGEIYESTAIGAQAGGDSSYWNYTLTPAVVNSSDFGIDFKYNRPTVSGTEQIGVNFITGEISYTLPAEGKPFTVSRVIPADLLGE